MELSIESIRDEDQETRHDLARQAFGGRTAYDPDVPTPDPDRMVCAYDGDRLAGIVVTLGFQMTWAGGTVPCGGISGVVVRPEDRGRGVARALLAESFDRMRRRDEIVSALYPTTASLYRSVGFEVAGWYQWRRIPLEAIDPRPADGGVAWERVEFGDERVRPVHEAMSSTMDGWFRADDVWWGRFWHQASQDGSKNRYAYVGLRDGAPAAALVYRYDPSEDRLYELGLDLLAGVDHDAVAAALGFLARNGTTAGRVETTLPDELLAVHLPQVQRAPATNDWPWMFRLVDVAGAVEQRRWPTSVAGEVHLDVVDPVIAANTGPVVVELAGGKASVSPGGDARVRIAVQDLAAIYAGADVNLRHRAGRLPGATDADLDLLGAACTARPSMPFFF
ncbi:MAG: GNAT family N-acetyltransferase [Acidimicrobiales bacterium]|nr:GNAT family N-acetyltransferase [Acidimicrobiales bacterium]